MKPPPFSKIRHFCFLTILLLVASASVNGSEAAWPGVDESVVEKYAAQYGRTAKPPLVNTDQGDMLLFVFLLAGAAGGFVAGYAWRSLMVKPTSAKIKDHNQHQVNHG